MAEEVQFGVKEIVLSSGAFGPAEIKQLTEAIASDFGNYRLLREAVGELEVHEEAAPAEKVRLGICYYLLGRYRLATDALANADGGALAHFYRGKALFAQGKYPEALACYETAAGAGYDANQSALARVEALRYSGDSSAALAALDALSGAVEQTAEYLYQRGATVAKLGGNPDEVVALFERGIESDPHHIGAVFGLAIENDRRGNDDDALELYQRSVGRLPAHIGSLLNLGILYEDRQRFDLAAQCYRRILDVFPNEPRARLFLRDAQASGDMYYDEDAIKRRDREGQVMSIPVTDFELSVRSRNCLQKMGLLTLGDLARTSEQELLASKNFGETSLVEIREMMVSKGLELGQHATEKTPLPPPIDVSMMSPDEQALLGRPIADLNLSVRARKCMIRLGISTVGELVRRTGDELLECKNFGVTSLNEVREKLEIHTIKLRGD